MRRDARKEELSVEGAVRRLASYLEAFNRADWDAIRDDHLDEHVQAYVNGKLVLEGRESFQAAYRADFDRQKQVELVGEPELVDPVVNSNADDSLVSIRVKLLSKAPAQVGVPPSSPTTVDVIYTYSKSSGTQVRHDIFLDKTTPS